jgi:hypothetical protein
LPWPAGETVIQLGIIFKFKQQDTDFQVKGILNGSPSEEPSGSRPLQVLKKKKKSTSLKKKKNQVRNFAASS